MTTSAPKRLLFSSQHCYLDPTSGAAISLRDLFHLLRERGWDCQVFCGPQLDHPTKKPFAENLQDWNIQHKHRDGNADGVPFDLFNFNLEGVPVAVVEAAVKRPDNKPPVMRQGKIHLAMFRQVIEQFKPDVLLTYGGQFPARECMTIAREQNCAIVFWLRNMAYRGAQLFKDVQGILVPSQFAANHYRDKLGLDCTPIASPMNWPRIQCRQIERKFLTFVNPVPAKGVFIVARIAEQLAIQRPDIPLLIVEGRGNVDWVIKTGLRVNKMPNLNGMHNTPNPKEFYRVTRVLLVPSLWQETFGRVSVEAMINGIPVLGSNRGGIPEVLSKAGFLFDIPKKYTPETTVVPTEEEVRPWIDSIIRLWDDQQFYEAECKRAKEAAQQWSPEVLGQRHDEFFTELLSRRS